MSETAQHLFKKIVLKNKIMDEATADRLLIQFPNPEVAVKFLVKKGKLSEKIGGQLLNLYQKQLQKHSGDSHVLTDAGPQRERSADESFDAMFDEIVSGSGVSSPQKASESATAVAEPKASTATQEPPAAKTPDDGEDLPMLELDTDDEQPAVEVAPKSKPAPKAPTTPAKPAAKPAAAGQISPIIKKILQFARKVNASDVHIKSGEVPIVRLAGRLIEIENHPPMKAEQCEEALLTLLDDERRSHFLETNDLDFCYDGGEELGRFRSNFMRQHRGMDGIFRLISSKVPGFDELKLPPIVKKFTEYKQGIVLVTGPKGCGKTTTLAAMVDLINRTRPEHIITVEDPIEFVHPCKKGHVNQREVGTHTKTFSNALRAALREAPDVIMVGEMRDLETTSLAITAAETGHLVFATLHTPDALRTIDRVLDVFPPKEQGQIRSMLSESMRGIISQLLLPSTDGKSQELAVEVLVNTVAIGNLIREAKTFQLRGIMQTGRKLGMQLMDDALLKLAKAGKIPKEEAIAVATERAHVEKELG